MSHTREILTRLLHVLESGRALNGISEDRSTIYAGALREMLDAAPQPEPREAILYEHHDGRYAVVPSAEVAHFTRDEPAWHRVGPVTVYGSQPEPRAEVTYGDTTMGECMASLLDRLEAAEVYADRYRYLRERPLDAVSAGGVFAGKTPDNVVLNGADLDAAIDAARTGASS